MYVYIFYRLRRFLLVVTNIVANLIYLVKGIKINLENKGRPNVNTYVCKIIFTNEFRKFSSQFLLSLICVCMKIHLP